jgi:hypothetical protein
VRVCDLRVTAAAAARRVSACVFNAAGEPRRDLGIKLRALEAAVAHEQPVVPPPTVLGEPIWKIPGELGPHTGVRVEAAVDASRFGTEPAAYEAAADRIDLLR